VVIQSYNQHIGSFLPGPFGWFGIHQSLLGSREPTLSWNHYTRPMKEDVKRKNFSPPLGEMRVE